MRGTRRPHPGLEARLLVRRRAPPASGRGGIRTHVGVSPHDFQSCALSHSATRPKHTMASIQHPLARPLKREENEPGLSRGCIARRGSTPGLAPHEPVETRVGSPPHLPKTGSARKRRGWDSQLRSGASRPEGEPRMRSTGGSTLGSKHASCEGGLCPQAEGVGFEPTRPSRVNALAGRRLKPLGHPSENCPAWDRTRTLLIQSQTCCQLHHGAFSPNLCARHPGWQVASHQSDSNRRPRHYE